VPAEARAESPYERVLGERFPQLHPGLQAYFQGVPDGRHGVGTGTFARVGTPRRWLWPILWMLGRQGVLFPVWAGQVPFTVVNRGIGSTIRGYAGRTAVAAVRTFHFASGDRRMVDEVTADATGLVDHLGIRRRYRARFDASVVAGNLVMTSTNLAVRLGRLWLAVPGFLAPVVRLSERFDDATGRQHVEVITTVRGLGRVYEYGGSFEYAIVPKNKGAA
jgi:hypothetical protein